MTPVSSTYAALPIEEPTVTTIPENEQEILDFTLNEVNGVENTIKVTDYNENGIIEKQVIYNDGKKNVTINNVDEEQSTPLVGTTVPQLNTKINEPNFYYVNTGSMNYKLIDSFTGNSKVLDTITEWVYQFGAAIIPAKLIKNVWAGAAGSASYNTFLKPPTTKYYKTWIYQAEDAFNYYGRHVSKQYSDSSRTKLEKTMEHVSKLPK